MCIKKFRISFSFGLFAVCTMGTSLAFGSSIEDSNHVARDNSAEVTMYGGWGFSYHFVPSNESYKWDGFPEDDIPVYLPVHTINVAIYYIGVGTMPKWFCFSFGIGLSYGSGLKRNLHLYDYTTSTYQSTMYGKFFESLGGKVLLKDTYFLSLNFQGGLTLGETDFKIHIMRNGKNINYEYNGIGCGFEGIIVGKLGYRLGKEAILCLRGGYQARTCSGPKRYNDPGDLCTLSFDGVFVGLELLLLRKEL